MDTKWLQQMAAQTIRAADDVETKARRKLHQDGVISAKTPEMWAELARELRDYVTAFSEAVGPDLSFVFWVAADGGKMGAGLPSGRWPKMHCKLEPDKQRLWVTYNFNQTKGDSVVFKLRVTDSDELYLETTDEISRKADFQVERYTMNDVATLAKKILQTVFEAERC